MRDSKVLRKLKQGEKVVCFKVNIPATQVAEIAAISGFDCIWLDMEHVPQDWSSVANQTLAAKAWDADVMVRVERGSYSDYIKPFELDASGIMVPHVMSLEDARSVVRTTRFHPVGRRPIDGGNGDGNYTDMDFGDYLKRSDEQKFVVLQIEDPEPLGELDAIAQLEGYDMLFFGPGDFSQGIGAPGQWDHPRLVETRELIAKTARKYGKYAGTVGSPDNLESLFKMGYSFVSIGADVVGLSGYCKNIVSRFNTLK